ncbi:MAG: hypothetical protein BWY68_00899 [bacterium ADurb.Bin400]|nr:MAG: hypothetical protein BWY68_00899 [bacterium ADurb.Bin400]
MAEVVRLSNVAVRVSAEYCFTQQFTKRNGRGVPSCRIVVRRTIGGEECLITGEYGERHYASLLEARKHIPKVVAGLQDGTIEISNGSMP